MLLVATAAIACDAGLEAAVAAKPADTDSRDALARSCARAGEPAQALAQYDILLDVDAANPDWLLGKSQALVALGRPREALPLLEDARRRSPNYEDVWRLNARALDALDEFDAADALLREAAAQFPQAGWPAERKAALDERRLLERGTRVSADVSYEDLSGGRDPWKGASIGLDRRLGGSRRLFAGAHLEERFGTRDEQLLAGFADRLGERWSYGLSADVSPDAQVLPEWSFTAEAGRALPQDFAIAFRLRHADYAASQVDSLAGSVDKYAFGFSFGYSLNAAKTSDISDPHFGHLLRAGREYGEGSRAGVVVGFGEEAETVAAGVVQVTQTKSIALAGLHWTSAAWGISWEAGWYEQGDLYDRLRVRLGLEHRF
jgi:YaiO family outer membrane protein